MYDRNQEYVGLALVEKSVRAILNFGKKQIARKR